MRTFKNLSYAIVIALAFASCGSEKKMTNGQNHEQAIKNSTTQDIKVDIPCQKEAINDGEYYRALGIGRSLTMQNSRHVASRYAFAELNNTYTDIIRQISNCTLYDNVNLKEILVDFPINTPSGNTACESMTQDESGHFISYMTIEVKKIDIRNNIINELIWISKNKNLGIDFSEEKFVNYINKIMDIR